MTNFLVIASVTFLLCSCGDISKPTDEKVFVPEWDLFKIKVDNLEFWIPFDEDSSFIVTKLSDSVTKNFRPNQKTYITKKILIPKADKDTILQLAIDAITKPVLTTQQVTCYAGQYVTLSLDYAQGTKLECKYSSLSNWTSISPTLKQISRRTFEKYGH